CSVDAGLYVFAYRNTADSRLYWKIQYLYGGSQGGVHLAGSHSSHLQRYFGFLLPKSGNEHVYEGCDRRGRYPPFSVTRACPPYFRGYGICYRYHTFDCNRVVSNVVLLIHLGSGVSMSSHIKRLTP